MATLKEHQAAMVDLLANGSGIPASASRLAHAMHDVLVFLTEPAKIPEGFGLPLYSQRKAIREQETTPGLNDKALSKREKALKTDSPAKWPTPAEQRVKELENTLAQLRKQRAKDKATIAELKQEVEHKNELLHESANKLMVKYKPMTERDLLLYTYPGLESLLHEQAGCRKDDTQVCEHQWNDDYSHSYSTFCLKCGAKR